MDISRFRSTPFSDIKTEIGNVYLSHITYGDQSKLFKFFDAPIENVDANLFFTKFITYIGTLKSASEEYIPLTIEETKKLSKQDLENIAQRYIADSNYLFEEKITDHQNDNASDIKYPKKDTENYVHYLHRLIAIHQKETKQTINKMMGNLRGFSPDLTKSIIKTQTLGHKILQSNLIEPSIIKPISTNINWDDLDKQNEKKRRAPFDDLAIRLDKLTLLTEENTEYLIQANNTQIQIASEIKNSGDSANIQASNNFKLTGLVIALTIFGLIFSIWSNTVGTEFSNDTKIIFDNSNKIQQDILGELKNINQNFSDAQIEIQKLKAELEKLKLINSEYLKKIIELEEQPSKISNH